MTPFGRQPVTLGLLAARALCEAPAPERTPDKWALLRDLTVARKSFHVSDRDLAVLAALLSFHPGKDLSDDDRLIVFPSNISLSERAHGMAESTLRRHLAALVKAGLIFRRDSPNGKRYATRTCFGALDTIYGFDLRPLLVRAPEIAEAANAARQQAMELRKQRDIAVIALRDARKLLTHAAAARSDACHPLLQEVAALQAQLRRKLDMHSLSRIADRAADLVGEISRIVAVETQKPSANDGQNERHYRNSDSDKPESEAGAEIAGPVASRQDQPIPLTLVLKAAPDIRDYAPGPIGNWRDLVNVADFVRPMLGIDPQVWHEARRFMGDIGAAITLACLLQRARTIARPGGYLRALSKKAAAGGFSPGPMVMALLRTDHLQAA